MRGLAIVLRKSLTAVAAVTVLAMSVLVPLLDAGPVITVAHLEQPEGGSCVHYEHDHFACQLFQINPLDVPTAQRSGIAEVDAPSTPLPSITNGTPRLQPPATRSRAPPQA